MFGFSKYFWICSILFTINQVVEYLGLKIYLIHSYLDDLLCPGIVLGFTLFVQQQFTYKSVYYVFKSANIIVFVVWYSLLFELIFPSFDQRHHADIIDILMYMVGSFVFYYKGNNKGAKLFFHHPKEN